MEERFKRINCDELIAANELEALETIFFPDPSWDPNYGPGGRTLIDHAVLCQNMKAIDLLLTHPQIIPECPRPFPFSRKMDPFRMKKSLEEIPPRDPMAYPEDEYKYNPLLTGVETRSIPFLKRLIEHPKLQGGRVIFNRYCLLVAYLTGDLKMVKFVLSLPDILPNHPIGEYLCFLEYLIHNAKSDLKFNCKVLHLLKERADLNWNMTDRFGWNMLYIALGKRVPPEFLGHFLKIPMVDVNQRTRERDRPLGHAIREFHYTSEDPLYLLLGRPDIDVDDWDFGFPPFSKYLGWGKEGNEVAALLRDRKENPEEFMEKVRERYNIKDPDEEAAGTFALMIMFSDGFFSFGSMNQK